MNVSNTKHVVALCGSQCDGSHTRHALERTLTAAASTGVTTDLVALASSDLPLFDPGRSDAGDADVESYPETTAACAVPSAD